MNYKQEPTGHDIKKIEEETNLTFPKISELIPEIIRTLKEESNFTKTHEYYARMAKALAVQDLKPENDINKTINRLLGSLEGSKEDNVNLVISTNQALENAGQLDKLKEENKKRRSEPNYSLADLKNQFLVEAGLVDYEVLAGTVFVLIKEKMTNPDFLSKMEQENRNAYAVRFGDKSFAIFINPKLSIELQKKYLNNILIHETAHSVFLEKLDINSERSDGLAFAIHELIAWGVNLGGLDHDLKTKNIELFTPEFLFNRAFYKAKAKSPEYDWTKISEKWSKIIQQLGADKYWKVVAFLRKIDENSLQQILLEDPISQARFKQKTGLDISNF